MNTNNEPLFQEEIPGGAHWSMLMRHGTTLRLIDKSGGANVGMMFYNPSNYLERYNAPDTLKCQHTFKLTQGHCLYSDMGRIFCSIIDDTLGWHDTVGGNSTSQQIADKWGEHTYQDYRNEWTLSGEESFMVELAKYGMNARDMGANLNLFSKIEVQENGDMQFVDGHSKAGDAIELRFEMDTLVVFHTCPHPMNHAAEYPRRAITYQIRKAAPITEQDSCLNLCDENRRGFKNTELYLIGSGCND